MKNIKSTIALGILAFAFIGCNTAKTTHLPKNSSIETWLTKADQSVLLKKQNSSIQFSSSSATSNHIEIDETKQFQDIDGFGFTLTGGSAELINKLEKNNRSALLQELFGRGNEGIGMDVVRISIAASDLNETAFTYNDMPTGKTDPELKNFSIIKDQDLINVLKDIQTINPKIKVFATPWSAPAWMKTNEKLIGGSLKKEYYEVYAQYFVKYIKAMQENGIKIFAITPQNEPEHPGNEPSLVMTAIEQADFIKNNLGPAFENNSIKTKIIIYDHNCDHPEYPITVLSDEKANRYIDGSAFHLYLGDISALSKVHNAFPNKNLYFTEQYTATTTKFEDDLRWHMKNVIIGSMNNWSKAAFEWNLANDQNYKPHTPGGCTTCKGGLTINGQKIEKNVGYYIIAQASKFIPAGSKRIFSSHVGAINSVAFLLPNKQKVLIALNETNTNQTFEINHNSKFAPVNLPANSVATFIWD